MPWDCSIEADTSVARKAKTDSIWECGICEEEGEKRSGQRKVRRGKSGSEKPLDLRRFTVERILVRVSGGGGIWDLVFSGVRILRVLR